MISKTAATMAVALFLAAGLAGQAAGQEPEQVVRPVDRAISIRQTTQKQEEKWRAEKEKLTVRFKALRQRLQQLQAQENQLREQAEASRIRIAGKQRQLAAIGQISDQILPYLKELARQLRRMVAEDLPFLPQERQNRLNRLESLINDPDTSTSEKFRKAMEALQVEAEYGTTIEVYQQTISLENKQRLVNIFRLGRLGLFFQSLDRKVSGFFNVARKRWQKLPAKYNHTLAAAIDMGARRRPVDILTLPLGKLVLP